MADKRISQLIERTDIANNDVLPIVASAAITTNKVTVSTLQDWMQDNLDLGVTSVGITVGTAGTDVNVTGSPITSSGNITINIPTASATNRGLLSSADWNTFNNKQDAGNFVTLDTTQTITGQKTFSLDTKFNGVNVGRGAGSINTNTALGNSALLNNTTAVLNTAAGSSALRENTTGSQNTACGSNSLYSNTTGAANTATGVNALFNNETGMQNTAVGNAVSLNNTTGSNNTVIGNSALLFNTTGSNNVALGFRAGQSIFSGDNTITNNSIYIGSDTRANGNNQTNQIVIGHNAIGQGSNTVTIGNSSILSNRFFGTMRIGTINNGAGDFITTDANGVLTKRTAAQTLSDIGGVGGTGTAGQVAFWTGAGTQSGDGGLIWNNTNKRLGLGNSSPTYDLDILSSGAAQFRLQSGSANTVFRIETGNTTSETKIYFGDSSDNDVGQINYVHSDDSMRFMTSAVTRWSILSNGIFQSNGAQTIRSSTGNLTLATGGGNGNIILSPNGTGNVGIGTTAPVEKLHIGGVGSALAFDTTGVSASSKIQTISDFVLSIRNDRGTSSEIRVGNKNIEFFTNNTERLRITSAGNVLVGTTDSDPSGSGSQGIAVRGDGILVVGKNDAYAADFGRNTSDGELVRFRRSASAVGSISVTTSSTSYNTSSDYRLKEDLQEIKGLEKLEAIKVYDYKWKSDQRRMDGVLAHELAEILPYAVTGIKDGEQMQGVDYSKIVPVMIKAIQELKAELDILKQK